MKSTTEGILQDRTLLYAVKRSEAYTLRTKLATCDSTKTDLITIAANEEEGRLNCERNYRELDRTTVKKSAVPWFVVAGLVLGFLLGSR